ncbi:MAG: hypothetical protein WD401_00655 [Thermomicrobiaceae bacterium]
MVSYQVASKAIAINRPASFEGIVLEALATAVADFADLLSALVLGVVRLIISGRVAVGGFARS